MKKTLIVIPYGALKDDPKILLDYLQDADIAGTPLVYISDHNTGWEDFTGKEAVFERLIAEADVIHFLQGNQGNEAAFIFGFAYALDRDITTTTCANIDVPGAPTEPNPYTQAVDDFMSGILQKYNPKASPITTLFDKPRT